MFQKAHADRDITLRRSMAVSSIRPCQK